MKVGDLVRSSKHGSTTGIIVDQITVSGWNYGHYWVLWAGNPVAWLYSPKQLEVISESRRFGKIRPPHLGTLDGAIIVC